MIDEACKLELNIKAFIEGYYLGNDSMSAVLDPANLPWVCDSIIVELHDSIVPFNLVATSHGIINTNGRGIFTFPLELRNHSYYIIVRHRNAVEIWSRLPVKIGLNTVYDFTH